MYVDVTNLGATIMAIVVPDKYGKFDNIALHYEKPEEYLSDKFYIGSTIGRFANRIRDARFTMNGCVYNLDKNDGENCNHGGYSGFDKKIFDFKFSSEKVIFSIESKDREGGFPGNLKLSVIYTLSEKNELHIEYISKSNKITPVNFTNHSYFNLSGVNKDIWEHKVKIIADRCLDMNEDFLPTGKILTVKGTPYDFTEFRTIRILHNENIRKGYNTFFLKNSREDYTASVLDDSSGRAVDIYTSMPGIQFYTGDFLSSPFIPFGGICLEPQFHTDGVNHPHFDVNILLPYIPQKDYIKYSFRVL